MNVNKINFSKFGLWALRIGLAAAYLYSGPHLILRPEDWLGYLPDWFRSLLPVAPQIYLKIQGAAEILFALSFLSGWGIRFTAFLSALEFTGILLFYGIDGVSFRDLAILGAAISLFLFSLENRNNG